MSFQEPVFWPDAEDATHRPYSVSEITSQVKGLLEENLPKCWVEGELSQYNHHSSGHRYFTLKDNASQLSAVMFKWQASSLSFTPRTGHAGAGVWTYLRLRARGKIPTLCRADQTRWHRRVGHRLRAAQKPPSG